MTVLGTPEAQPGAVWALWRFVNGCQTAPSDDEVYTWMLPAFTLAETKEKKQRARDKVESVRKISTDLGFLLDGRWQATRPAPQTWVEFGDEVHEAFCQRDSVRDVLDVFASMVVEVDQQGPAWLSSKTEEVAERLRDRVRSAEINFNYTKWRAWTAWTTAMGLGIPGPSGIATYFPHPADRLARLAVTMTEARGEGMAAKAFLAAVGRSMPYLDGGVLNDAAWGRVKDRPGRPVSLILSNVLRDLNDRGVINLVYDGGDQEGAVTLANDGRRPEAFATVSIAEGLS